MSSHIETALQEWSPPIALTAGLVVAAAVYVVGWLRLRSSAPQVIPGWRVVSFLLGIFSIWMALGSPLALFDEQLLTVHMLQHLLLMTIGPPLLLLGAPLMPLLHGLPRSVVQRVVGPVFRWPPLQKFGAIISRPVFCWLAAAAALLLWHIPAAFTLALQSEPWHIFEHASFLTAGLLFWWPVIRPWPSAAREPQWAMLLYLFLATLPCDVLSGFLAFSDRVAYPVYLDAPRPFAVSVLADQECAAALMWTSITVIFLIAAAVVTQQLLGVRHRPQETFVAAKFELL